MPRFWRGIAFMVINQVGLLADGDDADCAGWDAGVV